MRISSSLLARQPTELLRFRNAELQTITTRSRLVRTNLWSPQPRLDLLEPGTVASVTGSPLTRSRWPPSTSAFAAALRAPWPASPGSITVFDGTHAQYEHSPR